ncbi:response regulator transcription factor [Bacillus sp. JCM 19034]|uniref:response regulator transcription factor n=1 Tax=Bacillus sp. JCM 19034 TaxID=1481928 RepID=UPI000785FFD2|nr:response regulator transcription factor [Bacillus sp. JCM 19034]
MSEFYRVLIVDDELLIRQGIKHYLDWEKAGYIIVGEASNGQEALDLIPRCQPHIVLTDIVMPVMDGEQLTKEVKHRYPDIQIIILSSFGEYDYVRAAFRNGAIDYILKPKLNTKDLHDVLTKAVQHIPKGTAKNPILTKTVISTSHLVEKVLEGYSSKEEIEQIKKTFQHDFFALIGVFIKNQNESDNKTKVKHANSCLKPFHQQHVQQFDYLWIKDEKRIAIGLLNIAQRDLVDKLKGFLHSPSVSFVLTSTCEIEELRHVYQQEWNELIQLSFYFPNQAVCVKSDVPTYDKEETFNLDWFTAEMKKGHYDLAFQYLRKYSQFLVGNAYLSIKEFRSFFNHIFFTVTILLKNQGFKKSLLEQVKYTYVAMVSEATNANQVVDCMDRFIEEIDIAVSKESVNEGEGNIQRIIEYISCHFHEPISLQAVAEVFHFNPSYLSTQFSNHMKVGFNEYVNRIRIEHACKHLITKEKSIAEISELVGYSDHSYFCKVFKKMKGVSPSQYRRKQRNQQLRELG